MIHEYQVTQQIFDHTILKLAIYHKTGNFGIVKLWWGNLL